MEVDTEAGKKRRIDLVSPEKRTERAKLAQCLLKLDEEGLLDEEKNNIVAQISEFMGDFLQTEYLRKLEDIDTKLDSMATKVQIQQLEAQVSTLQDELVEKDVAIHELQVANRHLAKRVERLERIVDTAHINAFNAKNRSVNNEQTNARV